MVFNGAVFQEDWEDFQFSILGPNGLTEIRNANQARIRGIEADLSWAVTYDFLISGAKVNVTLTALGGRSLTVSIPDIHLTNLGGGAEGITAGELTKLVLKNINKETFEAIQKSVSDVGKQAADALKDISKGGTNSINKAAETLKGVGDLFKKK